MTVGPRSPEQRALLALLRPGPTEKAARELAPLLPELRWPELTHLAGAAGLSGWLDRALDRVGLRPRLPRELRLGLLGARMALEARNRVLLAETVAVCQGAEARGLTLLPIKGAALLLLPGAPPLDARDMTDVDLLLPRTELPRAQAWLERRGYRPEREAEQARRHRHHLRFERRLGTVAVVLELHWTPYFKRFGRAELDRAALLRARRPEPDAPLRLLDGEDTLLCQLLHLGAHRFGGPLKWAVDLAHLLGRGGPALLWPRLWARARALGARRVVARGLLLLEELFGGGLLPAGALPPDAPRAGLLRRITPAEALLQRPGQLSRPRKALYDLCLFDRPHAALTHLALQGAELLERRLGPRLPHRLTRGGALLKPG